MSEDTLDHIKTKQDPLYPDTDWIGVNNAISRIRMYYGERTSVEYESVLGEYTQVTIRIPIERGESD